MEESLKFDYQEITELLSSEKKLDVIGSDCSVNKLGFAFCIHVRDINNKESSLLVIHNSNRRCLHMAKNQSKYLQSLNHPNIAQFIDEFSLGQFYFVQIERFFVSLYDWISDSVLQKPISELHYVEIALQMMEITFYLNKNKFSLPLMSTLSCFSIDKEMKIKLFHLEIPQVFSIAKIKSVFFHCKENNELFYYLKETLRLDNKSKISQTYLFDIWAVGICLCRLSGISTQKILNYIEGIEPFGFSEQLGFQSNVFLHYLLFEPGKNKYKYSFSHLIGSLQNQQKELLKEVYPTNDKLEKKEEVKKDLEEYARIFSLVNARKYDYTQINDMQQLMQKYGEIELILNQQAKLYFALLHYEKAIINQKRLIEINPLSDLAYFSLGYMYDTQNQTELAISYYQKALEINNINDVIYYNLGIISKTLSEEGFNKYRKFSHIAFTINSNNEGSLYNLAQSYCERDDNIKAILYSKKGLELERLYKPTLYLLIYTYCDLKDYERALKISKLSLHPQYDIEEIVRSSKSRI